MSGPSAYLGSRISLISKAQIRYEGVLHAINADQQTVTLSQVKSYGTENRVVERPTGPRDEIFDYIVFRATDIKDLTVCEPPRAPELEKAPQDPAIVSVSESNRPPAAPAANRPPFPNPLQHSGPSPSSYLPASATPLYAAAPPNPGAFMYAYPLTTPPPAPPLGDSVQSDATATAKEGGSGGGGSGETTTKKESEEKDGGGGEEETKRKGESGSRSTTEKGQQGKKGQRGGGGTRSFQPSGNRRGGGSAGGGAKGPQLKPDFDFDVANARFNKEEEIGKQMEKVTLENASESAASSEATDAMINGNEEGLQEKYYSKKKSFFDSISTESTSSGERSSWQAEKAVNKETFGVGSTREMRGGGGGRSRRGGGYRGRGGRGRGRGRGGGWSNDRYRRDDDDAEGNDRDGQWYRRGGGRARGFYRGGGGGRGNYRGRGGGGGEYQRSENSGEWIEARRGKGGRRPQQSNSSRDKDAAET